MMLKWFLRVDIPGYLPGTNGPELLNQAGSVQDRFMWWDSWSISTSNRHISPKADSKPCLLVSLEEVNVLLTNECKYFETVYLFYTLGGGNVSFEGRRVGISEFDVVEGKREHAQVRVTQGCVGPGDPGEPIAA